MSKSDGRVSQCALRFEAAAVLLVVGECRGVSAKFWEDGFNHVLASIGVSQIHSYSHVPIHIQNSIRASSDQYSIFTRHEMLTPVSVETVSLPNR